MVLEFFPWTDAPDHAQRGRGRRVGRPRERRRTGQYAHFARSDSTLEQLDQLPAARLPYLHLCDAPAERPDTVDGLIFTARVEQLLLPGDGGIDIAAIMRHMPANIPVALEIPMTALTRAVGSAEVARRAREAAARVLAPLASGRRD